MLEFMNKSVFNAYYLNARFEDCEPNLLSFNYITPMAICIEAMVKIAWLEYSGNSNVYDIGYKELAKLLDDEKFKVWLEKQYDINSTLIKDINIQIRKESNKFKHSLSEISKRHYSQKEKRFKCFYEFTAKYYKKKTGEEAPPWSEKKFFELMAPEEERIARCTDTVFSDGGTKK